jgi:hypothetical protein
MSDIEPNANDQIVRQLERLRAELVAGVWPAAVRAAEVSDHERVRDLVKLKVDIEAIDFALAHCPKLVREA